MTYNGWANYETWSVHLHFFHGFDADGVEYTADMCEELLQACMNMPDHSFQAMIVGQFLNAVNWQEIADHINEK
jgi:hypothetical protein